MKRRHFFSSAAVSSLAVSRSFQLTAAETKSAKVETHTPGFGSEPILMNVKDHSIRIVILLNGLTKGWVEYGETKELGKKFSAFDSGFLSLEEKALGFEIEGLKPGTAYFYKVCGVAVDYSKKHRAELKESFESKVYQFKTLDPAAAEAKITFWNDTHENKDTLRELIAQHHANPSDVLIWNGDITNDIGTEELLLQEYLNPAGLGFATRTPVMFSRGNHDVRGRFARLLSTYAPGIGEGYHYTFRQGPLACVVLDTGEDKPDEMDNYAGLNDFAKERALQRAWLEKAIEDPQFKSAPFKVAIMHIPLFFDQKVAENWWKIWNGFKGWICEDGRKQWHDLLVKAGIKMIISGHTHTPSKFPANAEHPYVQVTGGGPKPEIATIMQLHATQDRLHFSMKNLKGEVLFEENFGV